MRPVAFAVLLAACSAGPYELALLQKPNPGGGVYLEINRTGEHAVGRLANAAMRACGGGFRFRIVAPTIGGETTCAIADCAPAVGADELYCFAILSEVGFAGATCAGDLGECEANRAGVANTRSCGRLLAGARFFPEAASEWAYDEGGAADVIGGCVKGKQCGNTCIERTDTCHIPEGSAADANGGCVKGKRCGNTCIERSDTCRVP